MFVKYKMPGCGIRVREVRHFAIRTSDCRGENGEIINGAELYDGAYESTAEMLDLFAEYLASLIAEDVEQVETMSQSQCNPIPSVWSAYGNDCADDAALGWFCSHEAAERVLNDLCGVLAGGGQFFDMTAYGEDGKELRA